VDNEKERKEKNKDILLVSRDANDSEKRHAISRDQIRDAGDLAGGNVENEIGMKNSDPLNSLSVDFKFFELSTAGACRTIETYRLS